MVLSFIYKINIILSDFFTGKTPKKSVTFVIVKVAVSDPDYPLDYKHYDYKYCYLNFKKKKKNSVLVSGQIILVVCILYASIQERFFFYY